MEKQSLSRKFSVVDLIRYHRFASDGRRKNIKPTDMVRKYMKKYPELSAEQQLKNLFKALKITHPLYNLTKK